MNPTSQALQKFLSGIGAGVAAAPQAIQGAISQMVPQRQLGVTGPVSYNEFISSPQGNKMAKIANVLSQNVASAAPTSVAGKALVNIPTDDVQALSRGYDYLKKAPLYEQQTSSGNAIMNEFKNTADYYLKKLGYKAKDIKFMNEDQKWQAILPEMQKNIDLRVNK